MDKEKVGIEKIIAKHEPKHLRDLIKKMAIDDLVKEYVGEALFWEEKNGYKESGFIGFKVVQEELRGNEWAEGDLFRATLFPAEHREQRVEFKPRYFHRKLTWRERFRALFKGRIKEVH